MGGRGEENTTSATAENNTETASQDSESTTGSSKASVESGEKEDYADYQPQMEHRTHMEHGRPEYPMKTFHRYALAPQYHHPAEYGYHHNQHIGYHHPPH